MHNGCMVHLVSMEMAVMLKTCGGYLEGYFNGWQYQTGGMVDYAGPTGPNVHSLAEC